MSDEDQILSRAEVLGLLSQKAREGSTSAMIALERALRIGEDEAPDEDVDFIEELIQAGEGGTRGDGISFGFLYAEPLGGRTAMAPACVTLLPPRPREPPVSVRTDRSPRPRLSRTGAEASDGLPPLARATPGRGHGASGGTREPHIAAGLKDHVCGRTASLECLLGRPPHELARGRWLACRAHP
jgi:hypothetical protein